MYRPKPPMVAAVVGKSNRSLSNGAAAAVDSAAEETLSCRSF